MEITVEQFNRKYPVGTKVLYFPIYGRQKFKPAITRSEAWQLGHGEPVVKLDIGGGGYLLRNIEINEAKDGE